jgi:hypothetical protein
MPFQSPPRLASALAGALAAGVMLTVAGCSQVTPLGPDPAAAMPQPHQLRSALVLEEMHMVQSAPGGSCPAGSVEASWSSGQAPGCYRATGTPVTITSAGVSGLTSFQPPAPPGQPAQYGFWIAVPAADAPAVSAVITAVSGPGGTKSPSGAQGPVSSAVPVSQPVPAVSVAGDTMLLRGFSSRFAGREIEVFLNSRNQALQLQRALTPSG